MTSVHDQTAPRRERAGSDTDDPDGARSDAPHWWSRFLAGSTTGQRLVRAVGALATALLATAALAAGVVRVIGAAADAGPSLGGPPTVATQTESADGFVRFLLANEQKTVQLDTRVTGEPGPAHVSLHYDCAKRTGCSLVRVESNDDSFDRVEGGVWIQGCYLVVREGNGYGAEHLDIELHARGSTCPA
jgi:hypothetical protein